MKLLNLLFFTFDDEFYVIDDISELEVRERLTAEVSKEPRHLLTNTTEPLWGSVGKNAFRVWISKFQLLPSLNNVNHPLVPSTKFRDTTATGQFKNISPYNNRILLSLEFESPFKNIVIAIAATVAFLFGAILCLTPGGQLKSGFIIMGVAFICRVCADLNTASDVSRLRVYVLDSFSKKKTTRVSKLPKGDFPI